MCVVSMIGDHYNDKWKDQPWNNPYNAGKWVPLATQQQIDELRKEVEEMKELLKKAKIYDEENDQKDCEMDEKVELLKRVAELVGVDLSEVFGNK